MIIEVPKICRNIFHLTTLNDIYWVEIAGFLDIILDYSMERLKVNLLLSQFWFVN